MSNQMQKVNAQMVSLEGKQGSYQLVKKDIAVPQDLVYKISKDRGGFLASAYDIFAREVGISFSIISTEMTYDKKGNVKSAKVRFAGEYYNASGKLVHDEAECCIDIESAYQESRAKWEKKLYGCRTMADAKAQSKNPEFVVESEYVGKDKKVFKNYAERPISKVVKDDDGIHVEYILPDEDEVELWQNFMTLRKNALQKAQTVARRTLTQRAMAAKGFDASNPNGGKTMPIYNFVKVAGAASDDTIASELYETKDEVNAAQDVRHNEPEYHEDYNVDQHYEYHGEQQEELFDEKPSNSTPSDCEGCGNPLSQGDLKWCPRKNGEYLCYTCWQAKK